MYNAIVVLGMHRSGTSLLAEIISRWGAYAGEPEDLIQAGRWNERGHWEFKPLVLFNSTLLASMDSDWCLPPAEGTESILKSRASEAWFKTNASLLISGMELNGRPWLWKDPRLSILLPFWGQMLDAIYLISLRNPTEIATSLSKRNGMPTSAALLLWQYYMLSLLVNTKGSTRKLFVEYDTLIGRSCEEVRRLSDFLDNHCGVSGGSEERLKDMMSAVVPELNHNRLGPENYCCQLTAEQRNLQSALESHLSDADLDDALRGCGLYPGWREYLEVCYFLRQFKMLG
jgi:hypothetical protein